MTDLLEILFYLLGFWMFVFNKKFRTEWINNFKNGSGIEKVGTSIEAMISIAVSLIIPVIIGTIIYNKLSFSLKVDACLDTGGSYNYSTCVCDHEQSHAYMSNHQRDQNK